MSATSRTMIELRVAESDSDLNAWRHVLLAVLPNEPAPTVEDLRAASQAQQLRVLAELGGQIVGSGSAGPTSTPGRGGVAPRVLPEWRRRGVGTALLRRLAARCAGLGASTVTSAVDGRDEGSLAFARRFGFEEIDRQVEQVREVGVEPEPPPLPAGVEVTTVAERPVLLRESYELAVEGYAEFATPWPVTISVEEWLREEATLPEASFVAHTGGEIVGYAGLVAWQDDSARAVNGLTVVRRLWRGRGLAYALKRRQLAWAAANGIREIVTWTQHGNESMRRVNERLGYVYGDVSVTVEAPLPLP